MKAQGITSAALLWLAKLEQFCKREGRACYGQYSPEVLRDYLTFHMNQNTLAWTREGENIVSCGVAWQCMAEDVIRAATYKQHLFDWQPTAPHGNSVFIADVVATTPTSALAIFQRFTERFPQWRDLHVYTFRRGKLVWLPHKQLIRFVKQQYKKVGG